MAVIRVEVVYALPRASDVTRVELGPGATLADALAASGLRERHAALRGGFPAVGINGVRAAPRDAVSDGDRVEVYRPLQAEPGEARRRRAARRPRR